MEDERSETLESTSTERRLHDRSRLIVDLFFDGADMTGVASTKDISAGGLYMNTKALLPEGALLTLRLPFEEGDVVVNAEVMYAEPGHGVGVSFHGLRENDRGVIERALAEQ